MNATLEPTPAPETKPASFLRPAFWPSYFVAVWAIASGILALSSFSIYPAGWAVFTRPFLAIVGIAGGLLVFCGDPWWKPLLRIWALAQVAVIVVDPSGELTRQPLLWFVALTRGTGIASTADQVVAIRTFGINFMGVLLYLFLWYIISQRYYQDVPARAFQFLALRVVRSLFVAVTLIYAACLAWFWGKPWIESRQALAMIDCPPPGMEVYAGPVRLGTAPLAITHDKLVAWGLSKQDRPPRAQLNVNPMGNGLLLAGNSAATNLLFKPVWWCANRYATYQSEWGLRGVPDPDLVRCGPTNARVSLISTQSFGMVLTARPPNPAVPAPGELIEIPFELRRNPRDIRVPHTPPAEARGRPVMGLVFMKGSSVQTRQADLPPEFANPPIGSVLSQTCKVAAPDTPGRYEYWLVHDVLSATNTSKKVDYGRARTYGVLEVKNP